MLYYRQFGNFKEILYPVVLMQFKMLLLRYINFYSHLFVIYNSSSVNCLSNSFACIVSGVSAFLNFLEEVYILWLLSKGGVFSTNDY